MTEMKEDWCLSTSSVSLKPNLFSFIYSWLYEQFQAFLPHIYVAHWQHVLLFLLKPGFNQWEELELVDDHLYSFLVYINQELVHPFIYLRWNLFLKWLERYKITLVHDLISLDSWLSSGKKIVASLSCATFKKLNYPQYHVTWKIGLVDEWHLTKAQVTSSNELWSEFIYCLTHIHSFQTFSDLIKQFSSRSLLTKEGVDWEVSPDKTTLKAYITQGFHHWIEFLSHQKLSPTESLHIKSWQSHSLSEPSPLWTSLWKYFCEILKWEVNEGLDVYILKPLHLYSPVMDEKSPSTTTNTSLQTPVLNESSPSSAIFLFPMKNNHHIRTTSC